MPTDHTAALVALVLKDVRTIAQHIFNLKIVPGVNSVKVSFETVQPTIPVITCTAPDGAVAFALPLFGGMRTKHEGVLGETKPLRQATEHSLKIVAAGTNAHGQRIEKKVVTNFRTGSRQATIMLDTIDVHNDSDAGGDGELDIFFTAGDVESTKLLSGFLEWPYLEINDRDEPFNLNLTMDAIANAPRRIWVSASAIDDDGFSLFPSFEELDDPDYGAQLSFRGEGSRGNSTVSHDYSNITRVFDIDGIGPFGGGDQTFRIDLPTGNFALAYTVTGRMRVTTTAPPPIELRLVPYADYMGTADLGTVGKVKMAPRPGIALGGGGGDGGGFGHLVAVGAEGAVYHRPVARKDASDSDWTRAPGEVELPVKALTARDGSLNLFAYDRDGGLLHQRPRAGAAETPWIRLGDRVAGILSVAESPDGDIEVFGLGEDGTLHHTRIGSEGRHGDWQRIGDGVAGSVSALALADGTIVVFALGRSGGLLYKQRRGRWWQPEDLAWHSIRKAPGERLFVIQSGEGNGVIIGALGDDDHLRTLEWPTCPEGRPSERWTDIGTIDRWLDQQPPRTRSRNRKRAGDVDSPPLEPREPKFDVAL